MFQRMKFPVASAAVLGAGMLLLTPLSLVGQDSSVPGRISLKPANGGLAEEFTSIDFVRELVDGRVVIADRSERRLVVADFKRDRSRPLQGREAGLERSGESAEFFQLGQIPLWWSTVAIAAGCY